MTGIRESYVVPPLTSTADVGALEAWLADAEGEPGILLAAGRVTPTGTVAWVIAQQWKLAGLVNIETERDGAGWKWFAVRVAAVPDQGAPVGGAARSVRGGRATEPLAPDGAPVSDNILRAIKRAANMGQAAPSLNDLARGAGLKSAANARYYVEKLKVRGAIGVETKVFAGAEKRRFRILDGKGMTLRETGWGK